MTKEVKKIADPVMWVFSFSPNCVGVAQPVSGFILERITLCVSVDSMYSLEEGNSRASYVTMS